MRVCIRKGVFGILKLTDQEFERLRSFMYDGYGINLQKKRALIEGRLSRTVESKGFENFQDYINFIMQDKTGGEISLLISKLTTNFTYFMREEQHYNFMSSVALPEWTSVIKDNDLRTWSAGCSSGEEAYSAAMVIKEFLGSKAQAWDYTILGTDISDNVLAQAKAGVYEEGKLGHLPKEWRKAYFQPGGQEGFRLVPEMQKKVTFGKFNLMDPFPFRKKFHIIFCRNVMIYFDNPTREALAEKFYNHLMDGGYFFIGLSETLSNLRTRFTPVKPAIYRKG